MKKYIFMALVVILALSLAPAAVFANPPGAPDAQRIYKFNIIGVSNQKNVDMTQDNGKRMFVSLGSKDSGVKTKIMLEESEIPYNEPGAFDILDANGTDGEAVFQLPAPGYGAYIMDGTDKDIMSDYSIFVRPLGQPGGYANITTCADLLDSTIGDLVPNGVGASLNRNEGTATCSLEQVGQAITGRPQGKSQFWNVTAELTSIVLAIDVDYDGDGNIDEVVYVRAPIFDDALENWYWEYDNHGLKLLQVWIYDMSTDVSEGDGAIVP